MKVTIDANSKDQSLERGDLILGRQVVDEHTIGSQVRFSGQEMFTAKYLLLGETQVEQFGDAGSVESLRGGAEKDWDLRGLCESD